MHFSQNTLLHWHSTPQARPAALHGHRVHVDVFPQAHGPEYALTAPSDVSADGACVVFSFFRGFSGCRSSSPPPPVSPPSTVGAVAAARERGCFFDTAPRGRLRFCPRPPSSAEKSLSCSSSSSSSTPPSSSSLSSYSGSPTVSAARTIAPLSSSTKCFTALSARGKTTSRVAPSPPPPLTSGSGC